jgi:hypothetical protein
MLVLFYVEKLYADPVIHKQIVGGWKTLAVSISAIGEFHGGYLIGERMRCRLEGVNKR